MKQKTTRKWLQHRDSGTGRYCSAKHALDNPKTTQSIARETEPEPCDPNQEAE